MATAETLISFCSALTAAKAVEMYKSIDCYSGSSTPPENNTKLSLNVPSFFKYFFVEHKNFVKRFTQKKNENSFKKRNHKIALPSQIRCWETLVLMVFA